MRNAKKGDLIGLTVENCPYDVMFFVKDEGVGLVHRKHFYNNWTLEKPNLWVLAETADGSRCVVLNPSTQFLAVPTKPNVQKKRKKYIRPTGTGYLERIPFDFDKLEVGDKVKLRNGDTVRVEIIEDAEDEQYPVFTGCHWHDKDGRSCIAKSSCDILYILKPRKKEECFVVKTHTVFSMQVSVNAVADNGDFISFGVPLSFPRLQELLEITNQIAPKKGNQ